MSEASDASISVPPRLTKAALKRRAARRDKKLNAEIRHLQQAEGNIIPFTSFSRIVHEELRNFGDYSIRSDAVAALQTAAEDHITDMFTEANNVALYSGRETVSGRDFRFVAPHLRQSFEEQQPANEEHFEHPLIEQDQSFS